MDTDGCPIGKSISGEIAEIYMDWFEKNYVFTEQNDFQIIFWKRMRDDVFLIWKKGDANLNTQMGSDELDRFLWKLNGYENRIQFTLEREKEGILAFLDMLIKRGGGTPDPLQQKFTGKKLTPRNIVIGDQIIPELFYLGY